MAKAIDPDKIRELSYQLLDEISKDHIAGDDPLYKRLRLIKDLINQGADPNYVRVDREYNDTTTALEKALLSELFLHVKLLLHEGARMYDIEREALNRIGVASECLFRIAPELRQYMKYAHMYADEDDKYWLERVECWKHGKYWQLEKDQEILSIVLGPYIAPKLDTVSSSDPPVSSSQSVPE